MQSDLNVALISLHLISIEICINTILRYKSMSSTRECVCVCRSFRHFILKFDYNIVIKGEMA